MKKKFILFLFILINFLIFSNNDSSNLFKKIIDINNNNLELINYDFQKIDYYKYFYFYCLVSEETASYNDYLVWFKKIENEIDNDLINVFHDKNLSSWNIDKQKDFAEKILIFLHDRVFKTYKFNADRLSGIVQKGEFNCVSSSIFYTIFLKKYGFQSSAVETIDHVFVKVLIDNESVDVETTNRYGFDPGKKKDVLDEFGKVTGFNYVPVKDYKNRNDIDNKKLLLLIYHNLTNFYQTNNDFLKSTQLAYIIYKARADKKGNDDFYTSYTNYVINLTNQKLFPDAIDLTNSYLINIEMNNNFINLRFDILLNYVNEWKDYDKFDEMKNFLLNENNKFDGIKDDPRFIKTFFILYYHSIENCMGKNDFNESYLLIKEFKNRYKFSETEKLFENIIYNEINFLIKEDKFSEIEKRIVQLKLDFPDYNSSILKNEINYYINKINKILNKKEYNNALNEAKLIYSKYSNEYLIKTLLINCYVQLTIDLYDKNDINNVIKYSEEALKTFPDEKTLTNNYSAFLKNFINDNLNKKDYKQARKLLNYAKEKFPSDSYLIQIDKFLLSKNF